MNAKTSFDPYGLSNKMFKHIGFIYKEMALFNRCLIEKQVLGGWRHSVVTMLLNSGQDHIRLYDKKCRFFLLKYILRKT
jgi:hypothetical protein